MGIFDFLRSFRSQVNTKTFKEGEVESVGIEETVPEELTYKDVYTKKKEFNGGPPSKSHFDFVIDLSLNHIRGLTREQRKEFKRKIFQRMGKDLSVISLIDKKKPLPDLITNGDWTWDEWEFWYPILKKCDSLPWPVWDNVDLDNPTQEQIFRLFLDLLWRRTYHYTDELTIVSLGEFETSMRALFDGEEELFEEFKKYKGPWTYPIQPMNFVDVKISRKFL